MTPGQAAYEQMLGMVPKELGATPWDQVSDSYKRHWDLIAQAAIKAHQVLPEKVCGFPVKTISISEFYRQTHPEALQWSSIPPTEPGWYWWKRPQRPDPDVIWVGRMIDGVLVCGSDLKPVDVVGGQWAGPLETPKETA